MRGERRGGGILAAVILVLCGAGARADEGAPPPRELDVVATSHLDTQWRWTIRQTIDEYLPNTLRDNFALFERYPGYEFSFEGAFRYMLAREYYPQEYERLKGYIRDGRWNVAGSWVDAVDVNIPAPESLIRHALLGNGFHRREFGKTSRDVLLPDCFGFGFALPTIAAHCGLLGFSTQKLTWGSAYGVPFDVGLWEGVDGSTLVAALKPGDYVSRLTTDLSADTTVVAAIDRQGAASGLYRTMKYFGTGDVGGAPAESSVAWLERSLHGTGPVTVRSVASDRLARDVTALPEAARAKLPRYRGELLMTSHGAGCYTSEAAMKRWNRLNERLLDAAERAAVTADWLGASPWPRAALDEAWVRFLWHQFHDDLTGTSIPEAYTFSWNDEAITQNRAAGLLGEAAGAVARALDTRGRGEAVVVYNPLTLARQDVVEAELVYPGEVPAQVRVHGPDGRETPSQLLARTERSLRVAFLAAVPPTGFAVYDVRPAQAACRLATGLAVGAAGSLENARYRVRLDAAGDVASVFDKRLGRELLSAPLQLQILDDEPAKWPAWEIDQADLMAAPRATVGGPARVRVAEDGPARVALEITRQAEGSTFVQRLSLAAGGAGDLLTIAAAIDWRTPGGLLKAAFPVASANAEATYDLGVGVIRRGVNTERLYEVPAQQWADLSGPDGGFGVTVVNDCKYGWDHPDAGTLRLTLLHTPRVNANWTWVGDQGSQDLGHHQVTWGLAGHAGDWRAGAAPEVADRLNQPLRAFQSPRHRGRLGREFSLLRLEAASAAARAAGAVPPVAVRAVKLAEDSDEIVVRLQELSGEPVDGVRVVFARPVTAAREVNGAEEPLDGAVTLRDGALVCALRPFQPRAFAVRLAAAPVRLDAPVARPLDLPWNLDGISDDTDRTDGDFDGEGHTIAGELLPETFTVAAVPYRTGPRGAGRPNVVACRGQQLALPAGKWDRLLLLAAAVGGDREAVLLVDGAPCPLRIQDHAEPVGQWDNRLVAGELRADPAQIAPGYVKTAPVAWVGTHRHDARGRNEAYAFTQVCRYRVDLPRGAR
ncbi:MAG: alpha-mannosidase, partial [Candidatus Krumholzibacteriia bacterium]